MPRFLILVTLVLGWLTPPSGLAQALDPLLAPHAERYTAEIEKLKQLRRTETAAHEAEYAKKLDAAISSAKDEATISTLRKEREGVVKGLLAPTKNTVLPDEAAAARKVFLNGANRAALEFTAAKKKADEAYLKTLAGLAKQAKSKSAPAGLSAQVAEEKRRVTKRD